MAKVALIRSDKGGGVPDQTGMVFNVRAGVVELFSAHNKLCGVALSDFGTLSILAARRAWLRSRRTSVISVEALPNPAGHELMPQW